MPTLISVGFILFSVENLSVPVWLSYLWFKGYCVSFVVVFVFDYFGVVSFPRL